jgi:hypothetical protein
MATRLDQPEKIQLHLNNERILPKLNNQILLKRTHASRLFTYKCGPQHHKQANQTWRRDSLPKQSKSRKHI